MQELDEFEHEAVRRLPAILAELLDEHESEIRMASQPAPGPDFTIDDAHGRHWMVEVKSSSRPGRVVDAARQMRDWISRGAAPQTAMPLLVVPFMSAAGEKAANESGINWIDLSGNASLRADNLRVWVRGRPPAFKPIGRPSSPFAPKSARITRVLLLDPSRWWRQKDLVFATNLDDSTVSRAVRRLVSESLVEHRGQEFRARDPGLLLDAWAEDYRFNRHKAIPCHMSGSGADVARMVAKRLQSNDIHYALTGLAAAWAIDRFAGFRLTTVYVDGNPNDVAHDLKLRQPDRGANVQLLGPDDAGVFAGERYWDDLNCVSAVQVYLDLLNLPERSDEAAEHLRARFPWGSHDR